MRRTLVLLTLLCAAAVPAQIVTHPMVPMRDGVRLAADAYLPLPGMGRYPVVLVRTPYGKGALSDIGYYLTLMGYAAVFQDTRGHGRSEGSPSMFMTEAEDGYDTVEWVAAQSWSNGRVGSFGASALGINQYLTAGAAPPHLTCAFVGVASSDLHENLVYPGGCLRKHDVVTWAEDNNETEGLALALLHPVRDLYWDPVDLDGKYGQVTVPTLHLGGWYDLMAEGTVKAFKAMARRSQARAGQMLVMGPWTHGGMAGTVQGELTYPANSQPDWMEALTLQWLDYHLKGIGTDPAATDPVRLYAMGDTTVPSERWNAWRAFDAYPEPAGFQAWHLRSDGTLTPRRGAAGEASAFTSDPAHPIPTVGGANLVLEAGPYDQAPLLGRGDLLAFASSALEEELEIMGMVTARLYLSADLPDLDAAVRLVDIHPDGRWMLVADGIQKARFREGAEREVFIEPGEPFALDVKVGSTYYVFAPGHRIGCIVGGSNYPRFDMNPQTGEPVNQAAGRQAGPVTLHLSDRRSSRLLLPLPDPGAHGRPIATPAAPRSR
jgi:predicted acyl esterase